ncbi:MAG: carbohydrate kinase family protein [Limisphaerales bacterium]
MKIFRNNPTANLCVVGNINRDLKPAPLRPGDYLFQDGETAVASIAETIGGGGANSAFAAAALGARVAFLGKVGADALGDRLERTLARHGIAARLARDSGHPTGTSVALTFDNGQRHFISSLPNNEALAFDDLDLRVLPEFGHLFRADIWFSEKMLFGGNERLFRAARDAGLAVSIDLNWDPQWGRANAGEILERKQAVRAALPWVNLAHGNARELIEFADAADLDAALRRLTDWGVGAVVVHLGERGAGYFLRGELTVEPPAPVTQRVNTTGTGDVLSVCMMLLHQQSDVPIPERLRLANRVVAEFIEGKRQLIPAIDA